MTPFYTSSDPLVWLLALMVILPFIGGLTLLLIPKNASKLCADGIGLTLLMACLVGVFFLIFNFHPEQSGYSFLSATPLGLQGIGAQMQLGLNPISFPLFFLTIIVGCAAGFYAYNQAIEQKGIFWSCLLLIFSGTLGAFASVDIFYAFLFHEAALLPIFFALMMFGGKNRRSTMIEAGLFILAGSLPTLAGIINFAFEAGPLSFSLIDIRGHLTNFTLSPSHQVSVWAPVFWGCAILSGLWPFHSWVPKILTETPTAISMLIGGSLKFFGLYFLLQAFVGPSFWGIDSLSSILNVLCVVNIIWLGLLALRQTDFQKLVAIAAVMHMGTLFLAINSYTPEALGGMILFIVASGLATALLLMISGSIQTRVGSLEMIHLGGIRKSAPNMGVFLMMGVMALMALPCFLSFWGEFSITLGAFRGVPLAAPALLIGLVITAAFGLRALSTMLMGQSKPPRLPDLTSAETFSSWILVLPIFILGAFPSLISNSIDSALKLIISLQL